METLTRALLDNGVKRVLYSYYYIYKMRREGFIARMQEEYPDVQWFLDSGAYTFIVRSKDPATAATLPSWKVYKKLYFTYVRDTFERWTQIMELDLDHLKGVTFDDLADWRDEMFDLCGPSLNLCPVWHPDRGLPEWTAYCRDSRFRHLALGAGHFNKGAGKVRRMVMEAHQWNKTVHGLGMTRVNTSLQVIPYDTVDSTSWLMGQKFGTLFVFQNNKFRLVGKDGSMGKRERMLYRSHFRAIGVDWRKIEADEISEVRRANIIAWRRLSDRLEEMRKRHGRSLLGGRDLASDYTWESPRLREGEPVEPTHARQREEGGDDAGHPSKEGARRPKER